MRLTVIGCSGSFPGPGSPASCYLIEADGFRLLLDFGPGALAAAARHCGLAGFDAICISHLHADHCLDLCGYSVARLIRPDGPLPQLPVYGPERTRLRLARALDANPVPVGPGSADPGGADPGGAGPPSGDSRFTSAFDFVTLAPGTVEIGPLRVTAAPMSHTVPTFGFRVEHAGASLAYSADTGPSSELVTLARGADVLLCEASFLEPAAGEPDLPQGLHLTARQAAQHAQQAGAGRLVLTHLVPWNNRARTLHEASPAFSGPVSLAEAGQVLTLE